MILLADIRHARNEMEPFQASDDPDNLIVDQMIAISNLQFGPELEIPVETAPGDLRFRLGLRFVDSKRAAASAHWRRTDKPACSPWGESISGIDCRLDENVVLGFEGFYSGLGRRELESYGAGIGLRFEF